MPQKLLHSKKHNSIIGGRNEAKKNNEFGKKCMPQFEPKFEQKWVKNCHFHAIFRYRRIGRLGRIFGRIFGIGRTLIIWISIDC